MKKYIIFILILCFGKGAISKELKIQSDQKSFNLNKYITYIDDKSSEFKIQDILKMTKKVGSWSSIKNIGFSKSTIWLKFGVINTSIKTEYILEIPNPLLDEVELYDDRGVKLHTFTRMLPYSERKLISKFPEFPFKINNKRIHNFFLRIKSDDALFFPITIRTPLNNNNAKAKNQYFMGAYLGLLLFIFFFSNILYYYLKDSLYLLYSLFLLIFSFWILSLYGYVYEFILTDYPLINRRLPAYLATLLSIVYLFFARSFLNLSFYSKWLDKITLIMAALGSLALIIFPFINLRIQVIIVNILPPMGVVLLFISVFYTSRKGLAFARYYILGMFSFLIFGMLWSLRNLGLVEHNFITQNGVIIGSIGEVLFFSCALAHRIFNSQKEKSLMQHSMLKKQIELTTAYSRFVPHEFLTILKKSDITEINLGDAIEINATILFTDIRSFTTISEGLSPQENFNFINQYLNVISPIIRENGGFIDKFIGDAIMALFPKGEQGGVNAALGILDELKRYNKIKLKEDKKEISIGIGVHSGACILGTLGEEMRMENTVISDVVNVAARLESLTKVHNASLLISENVYSNLQNQEIFKFIDCVPVKGRQGKIPIYQLNL